MCLRRTCVESELPAALTDAVITSSWRPRCGSTAVVAAPKPSRRCCSAFHILLSLWLQPIPPLDVPGEAPLAERVIGEEEGVRCADHRATHGRRPHDDLPSQSALCATLLLSRAYAVGHVVRSTSQREVVARLPQHADRRVFIVALLNVVQQQQIRP